MAATALVLQELRAALKGPKVKGFRALPTGRVWPQPSRTMRTPMPMSPEAQKEGVSSQFLSSHRLPTPSEDNVRLAKQRDSCDEAEGTWKQTELSLRKRLQLPEEGCQGPALFTHR